MNFDQLQIKLNEVEEEGGVLATQLLNWKVLGLIFVACHFTNA